MWNMKPLQSSGRRIFHPTVLPAAPLSNCFLAPLVCPEAFSSKSCMFLHLQSTVLCNWLCSLSGWKNDQWRQWESHTDPLSVRHCEPMQHAMTRGGWELFRQCHSNLYLCAYLRPDKWHTWRRALELACKRSDGLLLPAHCVCTVIKTVSESL